MNMQDFHTPGQLILALLDQRGWTQRLLAIILGVNETGLNRLIAGKKPVTAEMAVLLGEVFDVSPEIFLEFQKKYDLARARMMILPDPGRTRRALVFGGLPVTEMIKRGWLQADDIRDVSMVEKALANFFGVDSINEIEILPHATKKTNTFTPATPVQLAWIYRVKELAGEMIVAGYSPMALCNGLDHLRKLLSAPEETRKVPPILAECGVRFVIVESISSAKIDGVCLWLNEISPVIGMSLRYDRIDNFWFVLRHEIEHVLHRHGENAVMLDAELEGERAGTGVDILEEERLANEAAVEFCVPQKTMDDFIARRSPFFTERDIFSLARTLKIHPGLIVGQLQYRTGRFDRFRKHLAKVRSFVTVGAVVDGWGDVSNVWQGVDRW